MKYLLIIILISPMALGESIELKSKREALRDIVSILLLDKNDLRYKKSLEPIEIYPEIDWKDYNRLQKTKYYEYVRSLLPYMLKKIQHKDLSTQNSKFRRLFKLSGQIEEFIKLKDVELALFSFISEKLRLEETLRACAHVKSQYRGQEELLYVQMKRVELDEEDYSKKQLDDVTNRIRYIKLD